MSVDYRFFITFSRHPSESLGPAFGAQMNEIEKYPAVYILANRYRGTIYVGVTSELWNRVANHKNGSTPGFTSKYGVKTLVWYEHLQSMEIAIRREKRLKAWKRDWKIELIEKMNPNWIDLHDSIDALTTLVDEEAGPQLSLG